MNVKERVTQAQALQFHRKAHKGGGHGGKRIHTRDRRTFCLETQAPITQRMHISSSSVAGSGVSVLLPGNNNTADAIYHL